MAAQLAVPVTIIEDVYPPVLFESNQGQQDLAQIDTKESGYCHYRTLPEGRRLTRLYETLSIFSIDAIPLISSRRLECNLGT